MDPAICDAYDLLGDAGIEHRLLGIEPLLHELRRTRASGASMSHVR